MIHYKTKSRAIKEGRIQGMITGMYEETGVVDPKTDHYKIDYVLCEDVDEVEWLLEEGEGLILNVPRNLKYKLAL